MAFTIASKDTNKIILQRESSKGTTAIIVGLGIFFLAIGLLLNYFIDSWEFPNILFRIVVPVFGVIFILIGRIIPKQQIKTTPEQITFDHQKGAVVIEMVKGGKDIGFIRYDEIQGFDIQIEKQTSSSSSSRSSTTYQYHVFLKKKDGGEWFLTSSNNAEKSSQVLQTLRENVLLNIPTVALPAPKLSDKISKQEGIDKTIIHWQNEVSVWTPVFLFVFSAVFIGIFITIFMQMEEPNFLVYIIGGFFLLVLSSIEYVIIKKFVKDATTRYAVSVNKAQFEYYEFSKSTGKVKNQKPLPLETVDRIVYSYGQPNSQKNSTLRVLTKDDVIHWQTTQASPMAAFKDIFSSKKKPIELSITALNPVECLQLEAWLQELIMKKSERVVM